MKKSIYFMFVVFLSLQSLASRTSRQLITDAEYLNSKLKPLDPIRQTMALKLADLYFDASIEINANEKILSADQAQHYKKRSLEYYEEALSGMNGVFKAPVADKRDAIQFQVARLTFDLNQQDRAMKVWNEITQKSQRSDLRRESALRMAEIKEISNKIPDIEEAFRLYELATPLCDTQSLKAYVLYRKAWTAYRLGRSLQAFNLAEESLELALQNDRKQILTDLTLFAAHSPMPVEKAIQRFEELSKKYGEVSLISMLAESYQTADQVRSFQTVTNYLNKKDPMLSLSLVTLEQAYSEKNPEVFASRLATIKNLAFKDKPFRASEEPMKSEALIFRTLIQLDGERKSETIWAQSIAPLAVIYIRLFHEAPQFEKVLDGTVLALPRPEQKIAFLTEALAAVAGVKLTKAQIAIRQSRLSISQGAHQSNLVLEDAAALKKLIPAERRKFEFIEAYTLKESNHPDEARVSLENFSWDTNDELKTKTGWLYLQILESQKDYSKIILFLKTQLKMPLPNEIRTSWSGLLEKAEFEQAALDSNEHSLAFFLDLCEKNKNRPLSCDNARHLAQEQNNRKVYLQVLILQKDDDQLLVEYEKAGDFQSALNLIDQKKMKSPEIDLKKLVFLEMVRDHSGLQKHLVELVKKASTDPRQEDLYFNTAKDYAWLPQFKNLKKWSPGYQLSFAEADHQKNASDRKAIETILNLCDGKSAVWNEVHQNEVKSLYAEEKKVSLVGRRSEENFKKRAKMLQNLITRTQCLTQNFTALEKAMGLKSLGKAYQEFADDIRHVPLPNGLTDEVKLEVEKQITEMATPFELKASDIQKESHSLVSTNEFESLDKRQPFSFVAAVNDGATEKFNVLCPDGFHKMKEWQRKPEENLSLSAAREGFIACHNQRISAYLGGRLKSADGPLTGELK